MSSPTASRRTASPRSQRLRQVPSFCSGRSGGRHSDISERGRRRSSFASDLDLDGRPSLISGRPSVHDDLEQQQSWVERERRRESEGAEAVLSEIAVPPPVEWQGLERRRGSITRGDEHEAKLRRALSHHSSHEAFLSEIVAPPPIERERTKSYSRIHPSRKEESVTPDESASPAERLDGSIPLSDPTTTEDLERRPSSIRRRRQKSPTTKLYIISHLVLFSILGTLARLGLQALNFYAGAPVVFSLLWPNFAGSLIMGFLIEDRNLFREEWGVLRPVLNDAEHSKASIAVAENAHRGVKKTIPLFIGLATGFCGSFTSFSAFMRDAFLALSNDLPSPISHPMPSPLPSPSSTVPRNGGYSFLALLAVTITTISISFAGFFLGAHIALATDPKIPTLPFRFVRRFVDPAVVFLAFGSWFGAVIMAIFPPDRHSPETWRGRTLFALVFAPLGCIIRFYASILLNGRFPSFPLGTFAVNIFGTMIEGMVFVLQHSSIAGAHASGTQANAQLSYQFLITCQLLQGVGDGFCGCLTTVSTWVAELRGLTRYNGYVYGFVTLVVALVFMVVEVGTFRWKFGFGEPVCTT